MLLDVNGNPISSKKSPTVAQGGIVKGNIFASSGGVEAGSDGSNEKLKSLLVSKLTQNRSGKAKINPIKMKTPALQKQSKYKEQPVYGKEYPGAHPLIALRAMAWSSTVVFSILTYRRHQLTKKQLLLVPKEEEPSFRFSILEYSASEVMAHPAFDDIDKFAILEIFRKIDPFNEHQRKLRHYEDKKEELTTQERALVDYYNTKHLEFHKERNKDKREIFKLLANPDPYFSEESSWYYLLSAVLEDLLLIDRGAIVKIRNSKGEIIALTSVDGITIRPYVDETGFITHYVQVVDGEPTRDYIPKEDVILLRSNLTGDVYMYGYGIPNMDVLWTTILSDLYIDKGNVDYYRKGGSVPEGFLTVSPPNNDEGIYVQYDKEELDGIQRQLQSIIMSDFTQVPIISGGKFEWIDLKGNRKDMQFKELAEFLIRKICAVFQVSPQDVGVLHDVNRSTSEQQSSLTKARGLETLAFTVSNYITSGVVDELREEQDLKLWFKEDDEEKIKDWWATVQGQLQTGYKSINQAKSENGEDPVPWGDTPLQALKNWNPEEALQAQQAPGGPGGAAGGPQLPPGLDQVSAAGGGPAPLPIPGQEPGVAPSLGQAPEVKSVLSEMLSPGYGEEYAKMDVSPLVKSLLGEVGVSELSSQMFDVIHAPEEESVELTRSVEYTLESMIKKAAIGVDLNQGLVVEIVTPRTTHKKANLMKMAMYLVRFNGESNSIDISPEHAQIRLHEAKPLPPVGEKGTLIHSLTSILEHIDEFSNYNLTIRLVNDEITPGLYEVKENSTIKGFINSIETPGEVQSVLELFQKNEENVTMLLERFSMLCQGDTPIHENLLFDAAHTKELTAKVISILEEQRPEMGKYYKNLYAMAKKHMGRDTLVGVLEEVRDLWEATYRSGGEGYAKKLYQNAKSNSDSKARALEILKRFYFKGIPREWAVIQLMALEPRFKQFFDFEEGVEALRAFDECVYDCARNSLHVGSSAVIADGLPSREVLGQIRYSYYDNLPDPSLMYDPSPDPYSPGYVEEVFMDFDMFCDKIGYTSLDKKLEDIIVTAVEQARMLVSAHLMEVEPLNSSIEYMTAQNDIVIEMPVEAFAPYEQIGLEEIYEVVSLQISQIKGIPNDPIVKSLVSKMLKNEELDDFETQLLTVIKDK